ncbi:MAG: hypothetical protein FNT15_05895 [Sulfurovum sp.]|nr:MAG: hypothetical protein FNT15_05895 [Sulfurovum sp.]
MDDTLHRNQPGTYSVTYFDTLGRKLTHHIVDNDVYELPALFISLLEAEKASIEWEIFLCPSGSAVVHRCIYNTKIKRSQW